MFSTKRLKKKSQSVDIASQGFSPTLVPASPLNKAAPPVAKTTAVLAVQENNTTNSQRRSPRCGELKRGYTIAIPHNPPQEISFASSEEDHDMQLKDQARCRPTSTEEDDYKM